MSIEVTCDGCGKRERVGGWVKPPRWFAREDHDGIQLACSRPCIDRIAKETGKTGVVLPI